MPSDELQKLRHTDFMLYKRIHAMRCYHLNKDYNEKKKVLMRKYYSENKQIINSKRKEYLAKYYRKRRDAKKEKESIIEPEPDV
jgi:hypothetical protein